MAERIRQSRLTKARGAPGPAVKWGEYSTRSQSQQQPASAAPLGGFTPPAGFVHPFARLANVGQATRPAGQGQNPNNSAPQFNRQAVQDKLQNAVHAAGRAAYFRRAGFGAALRYTLGMEQVPSHVQDYMNARTRGRRQTGIRPSPLYATEPEA